MITNGVEIVRVPPIRVVAFHALGTSPEGAAWQKATAWVQSHGWRIDNRRMVIGFDNPAPDHQGQEYGYEIWIEAGADPVEPGAATVKEFGGGLYAVLPCPMEGDPWRTVPAGWRTLDGWVQTHGYAFGDHQAFEKYRNPGASPDDLVLELYCPIREKA
jgi:DNA gyrase inhibitor GyrI